MESLRKEGGRGMGRGRGKVLELQNQLGLEKKGTRDDKNTRSRERTRVLN